jgi:hypothetical protein
MFRDSVEYGNGRDNRVQSPDAYLSVAGNDNAVTFASYRQRHVHVTAALATHAVAIITAQQSDKPFARQIPGQLHTAMASSLTRWSRITLGTLASSK